MGCEQKFWKIESRWMRKRRSLEHGMPCAVGSKHNTHKGSRMGAAECSWPWCPGRAGSRKTGWKYVLEQQALPSSHIALWLPPLQPKMSVSHRPCWAGAAQAQPGVEGGCEESSWGLGRHCFWEQKDSVQVCIGWLPKHGSLAHTHPPGRALKNISLRKLTSQEKWPSDMRLSGTLWNS